MAPRKKTRSEVLDLYIAYLNKMNQLPKDSNEYRHLEKNARVLKRWLKNWPPDNR